MKMMKKAVFASTITLAAFGAATSASATSYFLFDGDSQRAVQIDNGAVTRGFSTFSLGYPVAITNTIWLGNRDNQGAQQYNLNGTPTGATSAGGAVISQLLDGTSNGVSNFGVTCCGNGANVVTIANADWSNQRVLFNIGLEGNGIAFDTQSNSLFVSDFSNLISNYSLTGTLISSFFAPGIVGLAYEQSTDTLWGWDRNRSALEQYSKSGTLLNSQSIDVGAFGVRNPFGGEMAITASAVPEPATWAMMLVGFGMMGASMRYRRRSTKAVYA